MPVTLPPDPEVLEAAVADRIKAVFDSVDLVAQYVNTYTRERFADSDESDLDISTKPDPITGLPMTSIICIGIPTVEEFPYAGQDTCTQLNFTYPITFDLSVADDWDDPTLPFRNSTALV